MPVLTMDTIIVKQKAYAGAYGRVDLWRVFVVVHSIWGRPCLLSAVRWLLFRSIDINLKKLIKYIKLVSFMAL